MLRLVVLATVLFTAVPLFGAESPDTPQARLEAARRYMAVSDFSKLLDSSIEAGVKTLPPEQQAVAAALLKKHLRYEALEGLTLAAMAKNFTTRELDALARFYGSAEGKSAMAKFGAYMSDVVPILQAEMVHASNAIRAEIEAKAASSNGT